MLPRVAPRRASSGRHPFTLLLAVTLAVVLAACTSSSGGKKSTSAPPTGSAPATSTSAAPTTSAATTSAAPLPSSSAPSSSRLNTKPPGGGISVVVPSRTVVTKSPIPLASTATVVPKVTARIVSAQSVRTTARGPGEISGPGVKLVLQLSNGTAKAIGLDQTVVNVSDQNNNPASPITTGSAPFHGTLAAGRSATGTYVFTLPSSNTTRVNVELSYSADAPTIVFSGPISK